MDPHPFSATTTQSEIESSPGLDRLALGLGTALLVVAFCLQVAPLFWPGMANHPLLGWATRVLVYALAWGTWFCSWRSRSSGETGTDDDLNHWLLLALVVMTLCFATATVMRLTGMNERYSMEWQTLLKTRSATTLLRLGLAHANNAVDWTFGVALGLGLAEIRRGPALQRRLRWASLAVPLAWFPIVPLFLAGLAWRRGYEPNGWEFVSRHAFVLVPPVVWLLGAILGVASRFQALVWRRLWPGAAVAWSLPLLWILWTFLASSGTTYTIGPSILVGLGQGFLGLAISALATGLSMIALRGLWTRLLGGILVLPFIAILAIWKLFGVVP